MMLNIYGVKAGDGGVAGKGGNITVSKSTGAKIFAYNGNAITVTNYDYTVPYYEYNVVCTDRTATYPVSTTTQSSNVLPVITKQDGKKIIPCKIFAQAGTARETYTTNFWQSEIDKIQTGINKSTIHIMAYSDGRSAYNLETSILATTYKDITSYGQGIGSGAGYLEESNGNYLEK